MRFDLGQNSNFRRYVAGRLVSDLGDLMAPVAVAFAVVGELGGSAKQLGIVLACEAAPMVLFVLAGGTIADRHSPRTIMLIADVVRALVQLLLAYVIFLGSLQLWQLSCGMFLLGSAQAAFQPAALRMLPALVSANQLQRANATLSISRNLARLAGPTLAGIAIAIWNVGAAVAVDGATFVASFLSLAWLSVEAEPEGERESLVDEMRHGFREFRALRWVWTTVIYFAVFQALFLAPFLVVGPLVAAKHFGGAGGWAVVLTASGTGAIVGGLAMVKFRPNRPLRFACITSFFLPPALLALGLTAPLPVVATLWVFAGLATTAWGVMWDTSLQEHVAPDLLGRISAYDWFLSSAAFPLSLAAVGLVAGAVGEGPILIVSAVTVAAATSLLLLVPEVRGLGRAVSDSAENVEGGLQAPRE